MAQTSSSRKTRFIADSAVLLLIALALSYLETVIPITHAVPIPGFKLGFANIALIVAYFRVSPYSAALISAVRVVISSLLFSGVTTLMFSLSGAALSFVALVITSRLLRDRVSFIGISCVMALFHNVGQLLCCAAVMRSLDVFYYFPALGVSAVICGAITGIILTAVPDKVYLRKDDPND